MRTIVKGNLGKSKEIKRKLCDIVYNYDIGIECSWRININSVLSGKCSKRNDYRLLKVKNVVCGMIIGY